MKKKCKDLFSRKSMLGGSKILGLYSLLLKGIRILRSDGIVVFYTEFKKKIRSILPITMVVLIGNIRYQLFMKYKWLSKDPLNLHPKISILIPVYNHSEYLKDCIESALNQTYSNIEIIIVDDYSTEALISSILNSYGNEPKIKIFLHKENKGISETLNDAIINSSGDYLAFLDCDDLLTPDAIEKVVEYIRFNPKKEYIYTDRIHIDEKGVIIEYIDFRKRSSDVKNDLLNGMYTSHLKVISKSCFLKVGLFRSKYDSAQDYDFAVRASEKVKFGYVMSYIYKHRLHNNQVSQIYIEKQENLKELIRREAIHRRNIENGRISKIISIVMLTMNRFEDTKRSIESIYANTKLPFELIVFDNNSSDQKLLQYLKYLEKAKHNIKIIFNDVNLGCSGGRKSAIKYANGEYIVTLDNDICVKAFWLENLLARITEDEKIAATCAKVVFPDGRIQYNGGSFKIDGEFIKFGLIDANKETTDASTLREHACDWLPGGALMIKREVLGKIEHREDLSGAYEDNDYSLQIKQIGYMMVNCPLCEVVHYHMQFGTNVISDKKYLAERYNKDRLMKSFLLFYKYNSLIIDDEDFHILLGISNSRKEIKALMDETFEKKS